MTNPKEEPGKPGKGKKAKAKARPSPSRARAHATAQNKSNRIGDPDSRSDFVGELQRDLERQALKERICEIMASTGASMVKAAKVCEVDRKTIYSWRNLDPAFAAAIKQAYDDGTDFLKDEATERGVKGSDFLLVQTIKGRDPSWRDPKIIAQMNPGPPSLNSVSIDLTDLTLTEREALRSIAKRQQTKVSAL
jgi:hypothetical protein